MASSESDYPEIGLLAYREKVFLLLSSIVFFGDANGQAAQNRFERISTQDDLSHEVVNAILQDRHGFMWFGTKGGLDRYDGHEIKSFYHSETNDNSLSDSWITALQQDSKGIIWIGTRHAGLVRFDPDSLLFKRYSYDLDNSSQGLSSGNTTSLLLDRQNRLWIGTIRGGLSRFDIASETFIHYRADSSDVSSLSDDRISTIYEDGAGTIWAGAWIHGLNRFDEETESFTRFYSDESGSLRSTDRIRALQEDRFGEFWIGTTGGVVVWNRSSDTRIVYRNNSSDPFSLADNKAWTLLEDSRGTIWVGTYDGGLHRHDRQTHRFTRYLNDPQDEHSLSNNVVNELYEDRSGVLWIATDNGVNTYDLANEAYDHYIQNPLSQNSLSDSDVRAVLSSTHSGEIWIGTHRGLNRFDPEKSQFRSYFHRPGDANSIGSDRIFAIDEDSRGRLWLGLADAGVDMLDPGKGIVRHFKNDPSDEQSIGSNAVRSLLVDSKNLVWIGTDGGGLNRLDPTTGIVNRYQFDASDPNSLSDDNVSALFEGKKGSIWIGTYDGGLNRLNPDSNLIERIDLADGLSGSATVNRITSILELAEGQIWIGTYDGLIRYDSTTRQIYSYTSAESLLNEVVLGLIEAPSRALWLARDQGLTRFNVETESFEHFGVLTGLPYLRYNPGTLRITPEGELIVGGRNGFLMLSPESLESTGTVPRALITSVMTSNDVVQTDVFPGNEIMLSYEDISFTFEFVLPTYAMPSAHQFQYTLAGFEDKWHSTTGPAGRAQYSNRRGKSGSFNFTVRGTSNGLSWSEASFRVTITPPWWRTAWFIIVATLSGLVISGTSLWYWLENRRLEAVEKRKMLTEGREQERLLLTRVIHDAPLQNLYALQHKVEMLALTARPSEQDNGFSDAQRLIRQTGDELRGIIGELRPPTIGPFGLEPAIRDHIRTLEDDNENLKFVLDLQSGGPVLSEQLRLILFRIYQGAISNVIRHAEATRVRITFSYDERSASLEIEDNGIGFEIPKNWLSLARNKHYGMLGISEWAEAAGGTLKVSSTPGLGTSVKVQLPRETKQRSPFFNHLGRLAGIFGNHLRM